KRKARQLRNTTKKRNLLFCFAPGKFRFRIWDETSRKKSARAIKPPRFALTNQAELHVIQRAATPAREPTPITVDVVPRAVVPARVEQIPAATAYLIGIGVFFSTAATFLVRLFACCFISHNIILFFWFVCFACHIVPCDGGSPVMPIAGFLGKSVVRPKFPWWGAGVWGPRNF